MIFIQYTNLENNLDIFVGDSVESINDDTKNGTHFGGLDFIPNTAKELSEEEVNSLDLDPEMITAGKESISKGEPLFYIGTVHLPVDDQ